MLRANANLAAIALILAWIAMMIHLALFIFACIDTHRYRHPERYPNYGRGIASAGIEKGGYGGGGHEVGKGSIDGRFEEAPVLQLDPLTMHEKDQARQQEQARRQDQARRRDQLRVPGQARILATLRNYTVCEAQGHYSSPSSKNSATPTYTKVP